MISILINSYIKLECDHGWVEFSECLSFSENTANATADKLINSLTGIRNIEGVGDVYD